MSEQQYERMWAKGNKFLSTIALIHPTAVLIFGLSVFALTVIVEGERREFGTAAMLMVAMMLAQSVIGITNEILDYSLDLAVKPWRALPAGYIRRSDALTIALILLLVAVSIAFLVSVYCGVLLILGVGVGVLYSLKLKRTRFSWLAYSIAYPSLPIWVWASLDRLKPIQLSIYLLALPLVVAIHMVNQMRDFEEDRSLGLVGFVQHLGLGKAKRLCRFLLWVSPIPFLAFGLLAAPSRVGFAAVAALVHWGLLYPVILRRVGDPGPEAYRSVFRRLQISGLLMIAAWIVWV
jgi:4-hydroxybenzoate polyprenyltransferase